MIKMDMTFIHRIRMQTPASSNFWQNKRRIFKVFQGDFG